MDDETQQPVEEQVTSKAPATKQKNPKRVAAGKAIAERTRIAREEQKKALIEAQSIIAQAKPPAKPPADPAPEPPAPPTKNTLTTTQWLSIVSIFISLFGLYYKREEIKKAFTKKADPLLPQASPQAPPQAQPRAQPRVLSAPRKMSQMD